MSGTGHPLAPLDRESAVAFLRAAGSQDPDVLRARRDQLVRTVRWPKAAGVALATLAVLTCLTRAGPAAGLAIALAGWWLWRRGARNVAAVEAGYAEVVRNP